MSAISKSLLKPTAAKFVMRKYAPTPTRNVIIDSTINCGNVKLRVNLIKVKLLTLG